MQEPARERLWMYGEPSDADPLSWSWVDEHLDAAGTYWVVPRGAAHPHPRPVWGLWRSDTLHLSIGSPVIARRLREDPVVTVHLDSGTDVVVVEGTMTGVSTEPDLIARYNEKYEWDYSVDDYGPLTSVLASTVMAWRSGGWAGRDGFRQTGRWRFPTPG